MCGAHYEGVLTWLFGSFLCVRNFGRICERGGVLEVLIVPTMENNQSNSNCCKKIATRDLRGCLFDGHVISHTGC